MKLIFIIFIFTFGIYDVTQGEKQQIVKTADYDVRHWSPHYNCILHNLDHCTWTKDGKPFDIKQYGFSYEGQNNCSIRADVDSAREIQGLSCVGHIDYIRTTMTTGLNENIDLHCESAVNYERCAWKRNDENVVIRGRYSYTHDPLTSQDCSIRISQIESEDFGSWVCSYISKEEEIIEAYTINNRASNSQSSKGSSTAISTTSCALRNQNSIRKCEQQQIAKTPEYLLFPWSFSYSCDFSEPHHCTWLADNEALEPTEHGFFYETKDNCSIRANDHKLDKLHELYKDISCVGHISYDNTVIGARLNENLELTCQSKSYAECAWKRDNINVSIIGRFSYISNPIETKDCSIRISDVNIGEFGKWTCSDQTTEIIAAFTVVLKSSDSSKEETTQISSSALIIALSVSISVLFGFTFGLIWKKIWNKSSQNPLPVSSSSNTEPRRDMMHPLPMLSADEATPSDPGVNETLDGEQVRREVEDSNNYLHRFPLAPNQPRESWEVTVNEIVSQTPLLPPNNIMETNRDSVAAASNGYIRMNPVPSWDNRSLRAIITGCANEERLVDV